MTFDDAIAFADNIRRSTGIDYKWCVQEDIMSFSWHLYLWNDYINETTFAENTHEVKLMYSDIYVCTGVIMKHADPLLIGKHIADLQFIFSVKCDCGSAAVNSDRHSHYCSTIRQ